MLYAETGRLPCTAFWWKQALSHKSYLHNCNQYRLVKRAYCADLVQALGWGADIEDKLNPLGSLLQFPTNPLTAH